MFAGSSLLLMLLAGHALADFPLQGAFLAEGKNRHTPIGRVWWPHALTAHAMIHGGFVTILTGSTALGFAEVVTHWLTDWLKYEGRIGLHADQAIHIVCKLLWCSLAMAAIT
jgi:hypothetical protein